MPLPTHPLSAPETEQNKAPFFSLPQKFEISSTHSFHTRRVLKVFEPIARSYMGDVLSAKISSAQSALQAGGPKEELQRNRDAAAHLVDALTTDEIKIVAEVYTTFFHLLNVVEQTEIALVNRSKTRLGTRRGSVAEGVGKLSRSGVSAEDMQQILNQLLIEPTFTAHPTEARRPSTVRKMHEIARELLKGDSADDAELEHLVASIFATPEHRAGAPTVQDEVRYGVGLTADSLWKIVPALSNDLFKALLQSYPGKTFSIPSPFRFRSWIGGDRDGNVKVTSDVTAHTLEYHRFEALTRQLKNIEDLYNSRTLVLSSDKVPPSAELMKSLAADYALLGSTSEDTAEDLKLPHHAKLRLVRQKLGGLVEPSAKNIGYSAEDFREDLHLLRASLETSALGSQVAQMKKFRDVLVRAEVFGFHLQTLDLRQHTEIHNRSVQSIIASLPLGMKELPLEELLLLTDSLPVDISKLSEEAKETLNVFRVAKKAIARDPNAVKCCIMSMTTERDDFLKTLFLMKCTGLWRIAKSPAQGSVQVVESDLEVVPLFETIDDLTNAKATLTHTMKSHAYKLQLAAHNNHQEIMLGYSDSNKDGGYFMANLKLHISLQQISKTLKGLNVDFHFFHGRGGTVARGGGRAHEAILATPENSRSYRIRMTEQGEVISTRYGVPEIAHRHLEQILNAMMLVHHDQRHVPADLYRNALGLTRSIGSHSMKTYRSLVRAKHFWEDYTTVTPIHFVGRLKNASRAIFRNVSDAISQLTDLRAIPWVFSWIQTRLCLPGWYGLGNGLARNLYNSSGVVDEKRLKRLQDAYKDWPFFGLVMDNAARELARTRIEIGERYLSLGNNHEELSTNIISDYRKAVHGVLAVTQTNSLLENEPKIARLIEYRNTYTDLMNLCQISLLRRHIQKKEDVVDAMLHVTSGLVAAMQSSG